jgi:hypothetical protein
MSENGPVARPAGFHQVAELSEATATKAPPIPMARLPTLSTIWAEQTLAETVRRQAHAIVVLIKQSSYQEYRLNSLPARVYGVIRRPRTAFLAIVADPTWAPVLITTTVVAFVCTAGFLMTEVGRQALVDQWERTALAFGQTVDDAQYARMEDTAAGARLGVGYAAVTALANGPALVFALAALLYSVLRRTAGPRASYVQVLAVVAYAGVILALRQVITTPIEYVRESIASPTTLVQFFTMLNEASPVARFLGVIDLFVVWWIVVLAIGTSVLYGRPARRLALVFAGAYVALALLAALAMAMSGGTA